MRVYISADIEGVTNVTNWDETELYHAAHGAAAIQMSKEVAAACRGAKAAGASDIVIKDGHDSARNLIPDLIPDDVTLIRGWTNSPESMIAGIDSSFDALICIGYHSGAGCNGNPLSHTMNTENNYMKINGKLAAEFDLNTYTAAYFSVPVVFVSGDAALCNHAVKLVPNIGTVAVKYGIGNATFNVSPAEACRRIESGVKNSLQNISECKIVEPNLYEVEINFKECVHAYRSSFYPGVKQIDDRTIRYTAKNAYEMMTTRMFVL